MSDPVDLYCARQDVNERLLPGTLVSLAGLTASASGSTNTITYEGHGLETDLPVTVRAIAGGTLAGGLSEGTTYYVIRLSNAQFQLSATKGGSPIMMWSDGVSLVVAREVNFDGMIEFYSRWIDTSVPAHAVPFGRTEPVPVLIKGLCADLVAKRLFNQGGDQSLSLDDVETKALAQLARFSAGLPIRGSAVPAPTNLAVTSTSGGDPRGWGSKCIP